MPDSRPEPSGRIASGIPFQPLEIAVVGSGIAGLAAAWLLSSRHRITLFEADSRLGGHSNTFDVARPGAGPVPVDTGFIVYNEATYPNLTALFRHLGVATQPSVMSFAVSLDRGGLEYAGDGVGSLFAQRRNLLRPRFWRMLRDLVRFYREAPALLGDPAAASLTLGGYLERHRYSQAFVADHLLPMAAAIWSAPQSVVQAQPVQSFVRFCANHGLLNLTRRPAWRTVANGSRAYVELLAAPLRPGPRLGAGVRRIRRRTEPGSTGIVIEDTQGATLRFDRVVVATHADQALAMLDRPSREETKILGAFRYQPNRAYLHRDPALMPKRRAVWSSWNYIGNRNGGDPEARMCVTYWMNRLQAIDAPDNLFVTLNPARPPEPRHLLAEFEYTHPIFDLGTEAAQRRLWSLQGLQDTWYCGAYFGAGFHEDGLQAGLAVAEALGGVRRPWQVPEQSGRIHLAPEYPSSAPATAPMPAV